MAGRTERVRSGARAVLREIRREDITFMAASIAYHAFVSMLPILVLLTLVVSTFGGEAFVGATLDITKAFLPASGQRLVTNALRNASGGVGVSVLSVVVLLWGISKIFRAMDAAFSEIFDTERKQTLVDRVRDIVVVVLALALAAVGAIVFGTVVRVPATVPFAGVLRVLLAVLGLAIAFLPIYYVFPNMDVSLREVLPGVLIAAVGWTGLQWLFNLYVSFSTKPDLYGLIGTILLLVTWLYVGSLALLIGAAVNATLAGRDGDRSSFMHGSRRFGRQITDVDSFERRLDELVDRAVTADISSSEIQQVLRRQAEDEQLVRDG